MKKSFAASVICHHGIIGGVLYMEDNTITYKTNKLTVDRKYRNFALSVHEICDLTWKGIIFPVATFYMKNGEEHKFIIFNKQRFNKYYKHTDK